jgi:hypothetical protein
VDVTGRVWIGVWGREGERGLRQKFRSRVVHPVTHGVTERTFVRFGPRSAPAARLVNGKARVLRNPGTSVRPANRASRVPGNPGVSVRLANRSSPVPENPCRSVRLANRDEEVPGNPGTSVRRAYRAGRVPESPASSVRPKDAAGARRRGCRHFPNERSFVFFRRSTEERRLPSRSGSPPGPRKRTNVRSETAWGTRRSLDADPPSRRDGPLEGWPTSGRNSLPNGDTAPSGPALREGQGPGGFPNGDTAPRVRHFGKLAERTDGRTALGAA